MADRPCLNESCSSFGTPHPNCKCYGYAEGGEVCKGQHTEFCEYFADGGIVDENINFKNNPVSSLDHYALHHGLLGLLTKTGHPKSEDPNKHFHDYLHHSKKGRKTLKNHTENLIGANKEERIEHDRASVDELKKHLTSIQENPERLMDVGGAMSSIVPDHAVHLAAKAGIAVNYLNGLKPSKAKSNPLDSNELIDKVAEAKYERHLAIAQKPSLIIQHLKDGTLLPEDVTTAKTIYPMLTKEITDKAFEKLVDAQQKGIEIPYKQKLALSALMGQPLDSTMSPASMQAIIKSAGPQQQKLQTKAKPKSNKASGAELSQINKVNQMDYTLPQDRLLDKAKD